MTYEYCCRACGRERDIEHGIRENPKIICDQCGSDDVFRSLSPTSFRIGGVGVHSPGFSFAKKPHKKKDP